MVVCPFCNKNLKCKCELRTASNGTIVCYECKEGYESALLAYQRMEQAEQEGAGAVDAFAEGLLVMLRAEVERNPDNTRAETAIDIIDAGRELVRGLMNEDVPPEATAASTLLSLMDKENGKSPKEPC